MATLNEADRSVAWTVFMQEESKVRQGMALTKADLRAAIDATDDWVNTNAASFNTAIPQPARGALTARQKAKLLLMVVERRFGITA